jgi:hypothetical protein
MEKKRNIVSPTTFRDWLKRRNMATQIDKKYALPFSIDKLPCGCKRVYRASRGVTITKEGANIFFAPVDLWVRKEGDAYYCVKCGGRIG